MALTRNGADFVRGRCAPVRALALATLLLSHSAWAQWVRFEECKGGRAQIVQSHGEGERIESWQAGCRPLTGTDLKALQGTLDAAREALPALPAANWRPGVVEYRRFATRVLSDEAGGHDQVAEDNHCQGFNTPDCHVGDWQVQVVYDPLDLSRHASTRVTILASQRAPYCGASTDRAVSDEDSDAEGGPTFADFQFLGGPCRASTQPEAPKRAFTAPGALAPVRTLRVSMSGDAEAVATLSKFDQARVKALAGRRPDPAMARAAPFVDVPAAVEAPCEIRVLSETELQKGQSWGKALEVAIPAPDAQVWRRKDSESFVPKAEHASRSNQSCGGGEGADKLASNYCYRCRQVLAQRKPVCHAAEGGCFPGHADRRQFGGGSRKYERVGGATEAAGRNADAIASSEAFAKAMQEAAARGDQAEMQRLGQSMMQGMQGSGGAALPRLEVHAQVLDHASPAACGDPIIAEPALWMHENEAKARGRLAQTWVFGARRCARAEVGEPVYGTAPAALASPASVVVRIEGPPEDVRALGKGLDRDAIRKILGRH